MKRRVFALAMGCCVLALPTGAKSLHELIYPVLVCIKSDKAGNITDAIVEQEPNDRALNADLLKLLRSAGWTGTSGYSGWFPQYVDAKGKSAGAPVPEQPYKCPPDQ